ncbi:MAG TPA: SDR family oxidoreductase [Microbacterium sp.]|nr:SDR family oxidoreductase [Microbacterium sp.]
MTSSYPRPLGRVVVTGGSSGLGAAVVDAVRAAGGSPAVIDRVPLDDGGATPFARADVSNHVEVEYAIAALAAELDGIDAVVTAAGIDRCGTLDDVDAVEWERVIGVNLLGTAATVRAALPHLQEVHGRAVIVASSLALRGVSDATAYCASKFGVLGFARALAAETRGKLGVTTIIPAGMRTAFFDDRPEQYKPGADAQLIDPIEAARTIVFALQQPEGVEVRELVICPEQEPSWP